jgi:hypothetical protein
MMILPDSISIRHAFQYRPAPIPLKNKKVPEIRITSSRMILE